ncbi:MAG: Crp/Fnr family transcriptional regulator [Clostridia bacterium]|nr:Crp/Fnr family transcriptional regulator [Clostridia bacterium]
MVKNIEILKKCPLFDGIAEDDLVRMLTCLSAKTVFFDKKYTVFAEGTTASHIGILLSGEVQIELNDYYGNRSILESVSPSEIFAEAYACSGTEPLPFSVVSSEPSEVMLIECSHILEICHNGCGFHHKLIYNLMKALAVKNLRFHKKIEITSKRTTREKLLTYLSLEKKRHGKASFDIPFDRQELADYLEVERTGLSAEISKLKSEGVIDCRKNHFTVL